MLAKEAIKDVEARYCRYLHTIQWDGFGNLLTADTKMDVREDTGMDPVRGVAVIVAQVRFAVHHAYSSHQVHTPQVQLSSPDSARAVWAMQDRGVWQPDNSPVEGVGSITGY